MGANRDPVLQVEGCGVGARRAGSHDGRVWGSDPADGCHRPETDRAKISRNLDSSDLSCELTVIYLCRSMIYLCRLVIYLVIYLTFNDLSLPFSDLSLPFSVLSLPSVIYLYHSVIYSL